MGFIRFRDLGLRVFLSWGFLGTLHGVFGVEKCKLPLKSCTPSKYWEQEFGVKEVLFAAILAWPLKQQWNHHETTKASSSFSSTSYIHIYIYI